MSGQPHARVWAIPAARPAPYVLRDAALATAQARVRHNLEAYGLTRREREVAWLILGGLSNKEIAERLGISEQTVKNALSTMLRKADVWDRHQLTLRLLGLPLEGIEPPEREP